MYPENIVEVHGGKITAQNNADGIGICFRLTSQKAHNLLAD
jgi:hypothetical protein